MNGRNCDVLIVGAGPAGSSAALSLAGSGLSAILVDRSAFPRDKICGDALSVDVVNQLGKLSPTLAARFNATPKIASGGVRIFAPSGQSVDLPFRSHDSAEHGYVCRRVDFDNVLLEEVRAQSAAEVIEGCRVEDVTINDREVVARTSQGTISAKVVIGADGAQSVVKRKLLTSKISPRYHSAGIRMYHRQLGGFSEGNFIELYFINEILPGYLWVFPLPEGHANVGLGMLTSAVSRRRINLSRVFRQLLSTHPLLSQRFETTVALETFQGHGLPLGGAEPPISGERFLLTGDAASMIDPFSGEGIGNALRSGRFAAKQIVSSFSTGDFRAGAMAAYDRSIYKALRAEFRTSRTLLWLSQYPWVMNTVIRKARRNQQLHAVLVDALAMPAKKAWLATPQFYLNLLFRS